MNVARPLVRQRDLLGLQSLEAAGLSPVFVLDAAIFEQATDVIESCLQRGIRPTAFSADIAIRIGGDVEHLVLPFVAPAPDQVTSAAGARNIAVLRRLLERLKVSVPAGAFDALSSQPSFRAEDDAETLKLLLKHATASSITTRALCALTRMETLQPQQLSRVLSLGPWKSEQLEKAFAEAIRLGKSTLVAVFLEAGVPLTNRVVVRACRPDPYDPTSPVTIAQAISASREHHLAAKTALRAEAFGKLPERIIDQLATQLPLTAPVSEVMTHVDALAGILRVLDPNEQVKLKACLRNRAEEITLRQPPLLAGQRIEDRSPTQRALLRRMLHACIDAAVLNSPSIPKPDALRQDAAPCP